MKRIILLLALIFLAGCVGIYNPVTGKQEYFIFNDASEVEWGAAMAQQLTQKFKMLDDPQLLNALQELGDKIGAVSHRSYLQFHFYIIDDKTINAFAAPGGHIFFYKGLLDELSEDELAFVIAHEIGHVAARHSLKSLGATLGYSILTGLLLGKPDQKEAKQLADQLFSLVSTGYSRTDEYQADGLGAEYSYKAGHDPRGAYSLFDLFKEIEKKEKQIPYYARTHPLPDERKEGIRKKLEELGVQ